MADQSVDRRRFLLQTAAGAGTLSAGLAAGCGGPSHPPAPVAELLPVQNDDFSEGRRPYPDNRPNVILVRFGGGVRRQETIAEEAKTYCPFVYHELFKKQGTLFPQVEIASNPNVVTSHGQGTLYLLTGEYDKYEDISHKPLAERFVPKAPTIFEYLRRYYQIPDHQALIINGEDRINEDFFTASNNHLFGVQYRSQVLSLYKFKTYLLREELKNPALPDQERQAKVKKLQEMETKDYMTESLKGVQQGEAASWMLGSSAPLNATANLQAMSTLGSAAQVDEYWARWRQYYGSSGFVNPRGDRLLTVLALRALRELRPRLLMINYQDPDYVHWGNPNFYTRAISIIDEGIREIYQAVQADEEYRDRTVFVVVPDCGRDNNLCMAVPFQHHFGGRSSHEIFAVVAGPKQFVPHEPTPVDKLADQISVAATVGQLMGFSHTHYPAPSLFQKV